MDPVDPRWFSVIGTERDPNASIGDWAKYEDAVEQALRQSIYVQRRIVVKTDAGVRVGSAMQGVWHSREGWLAEHHGQFSEATK